MRNWKSTDQDPLSALDSMFDPVESQFDPAPERDALLSTDELQLRMQAQVIANNLQLQSGKYAVSLPPTQEDTERRYEENAGEHHTLRLIPPLYPHKYTSQPQVAVSQQISSSPLLPASSQLWPAPEDHLGTARPYHSTPARYRTTALTSSRRWRARSWQIPRATS